MFMIFVIPTIPRICYGPQPFDFEGGRDINSMISVLTSPPDKILEHLSGWWITEGCNLAYPRMIFATLFVVQGNGYVNTYYFTTSRKSKKEKGSISLLKKLKPASEFMIVSNENGKLGYKLHNTEFEANMMTTFEIEWKACWKINKWNHKRNRYLLWKKVESE